MAQRNEKESVREISPEKHVKTGLYYQGYRPQRPTLILEKRDEYKSLTTEKPIPNCNLHQQMSIINQTANKQAEKPRTAEKRRKSPKRPFLSPSQPQKPKSNPRNKQKKQRMTFRGKRKQRRINTRHGPQENIGGYHLLGANQRNRSPSKISKNRGGYAFYAEKAA